MSLTKDASGAHHHDAIHQSLVLLFAVLGRPRLWWIALVTAKGLVRSHWWRRSPFLPLPDPGWVGFRLETAYGSMSAPLGVKDAVGYLEWCQMMRRIA